MNLSIYLNKPRFIKLMNIPDKENNIYNKILDY